MKFRTNTQLDAIELLIQVRTYMTGIMQIHSTQIEREKEREGDTIQERNT